MAIREAAVPKDFMATHDGMEYAVLSFVSAELGIKEEQLRLSTRLWHDLGIEGDDAETFFAAFAERFQVDLSEFDYEKHFGEEVGVNPLLYLWWKLRRADQLKRIPITLEDLVTAAIRRRWRTPERPPV
jgi:hypothetical protein